MIRFIAKHRHVFTAIIVIFCIAALIFLGVRTQNMKKQNVDSETFSGKAMGTAIKKTIYAENAAVRTQVDDQIDDCLQELENQISVRVDDSEVSKCNRNYAVDGLYQLSDDLLGYLKQEMEIYKETNGAFSPCIRPISDLWGIEDGDQEVPTQESIVEVLDSTNPVNIEIQEDGIVFHAEHMAIDFGAVGKGIAGDRIFDLLSDSNVEGAVVSIGGTIAVYGNKGNGKPWHIGIQDPRAAEGEVLGVLNTAGNTFISTSGDYEKYFEADGKRYHHIFDPATGYPAESGLISVTIIGDSGFLSDALSTACFVMGLEKGMAYAEEKGVEAVFVTADKEVYVTKGIKKNFNIQADDYELKK